MTWLARMILHKENLEHSNSVSLTATLCTRLLGTVFPAGRMTTGIFYCGWIGLPMVVACMCFPDTNRFDRTGARPQLGA